LGYLAHNVCHVIFYFHDQYFYSHISHHAFLSIEGSLHCARFSVE
jgi:hypothetical protein